MKRRVPSFFLGQNSPKRRKIDEESLKKQQEREEERERVLDFTWKKVSVTLKKLETFMNQYKDRNIKTPWDFHEYSEIYTSIYKLCISPECNFFEKRIYEKYSDYLADYLSSRVLLELKSTQSQEVLSRVVHVWKSYKDIFLKFCSRLLRYLDQFFVKTESTASTTGKGYQLFRDKIFFELRLKLKSLLLTDINSDRDGKFNINRNLLREAVLMFMDMGDFGKQDIFEKFLEDPASEDTMKFYRQLSEKWIDTVTTPEYLRLAEKRIAEEMKRLTDIFTPKSKKKLADICNRELLLVRQDRLLDNPGSGLIDLIKGGKFDDIKRMCELMGRVEGGLIPIADKFSDYISKTGIEIFERHQEIVSGMKISQMVNNLIGKDSLIEELFAMFDFFLALVDGPFGSRPVFGNSMSVGFKRFCNRFFVRNPSNKPNQGVRTYLAQLLAYFVDDRIRRRGVEEEKESKIDKIVLLIEYVVDKDLFMEECRKMLSKRLLVTGYNERLEKTVISKFKRSKSCGMSEVYKLEKMLSDRLVGHEICSKFRVYLKEKNINLGYDLNVQTLTMNIWPIIPLKDSFIPPRECQIGMDSFFKFYSEIHAHRTLSWTHDRASVQLQGIFRFGKKIIDLSGYQASILLLFNDSKSLSIEQLQELTGLQVNSFKLCLSSLFQKKARILRPEGEIKGKEWFHNPKQKIIINENFKSKLLRIKVFLPRTTEKEVEMTHVKVSADRSICVDAALVRIMKNRKMMNIRDLINTTIEHLSSKFLVDHKFIKKRVESLFDREFIKRDENEKNSILYVA